MTDDQIFVDRLEALTEGPNLATVEGIDLVAVRRGRRVDVLDGKCPHQGVLLGSGHLEGHQLVCPGHGWRFDIRSGERVGGPQCLRRLPCRVVDGSVTIARAEFEAWRAEGARSSDPRLTIGDLPGPREWPFVGSLFRVDRSRLHRQLQALAAEYGPRFRFSLPGQSFVVFSNPEAIRSALKQRPGTFRRPRNVETIIAEAGAHGVFSKEGEPWRRDRRLTAPALNLSHIRAFFIPMTRIVERMLTRWRDAHANGAMIDVKAEMTRFTIDVTSQLTLGIDLATLEANDDRIEGVGLREDLEVLFPRVALRLFAPVPYWRWFSLPQDVRFNQAKARLKVRLQKIVSETRRALAAEPNPVPKNFLEAALLERDEDGGQLSDDEVGGNVLTMLLAGEDTTAWTLTWAIHYLSEHPEAAARVYDELEGVVGDAAVPADLAQVGELRYLDAVLREAMRLRPVAPMLFLQANVDTEVDGVGLPAGSTIMVLFNHAYESKAHFEAPEAFRPQRWLEPTGAHDEPAFMPFGFGPRLCPGRQLALTEAKVLLAALVKGFRLKKPLGHPPMVDLFGFTAYPSTLNMYFVSREGEARRR